LAEAAGLDARGSPSVTSGCRSRPAGAEMEERGSEDAGLHAIGECNTAEGGCDDQ